MNPHDRYDSLFVYYSYARGIDWQLLKAQVKAESAFKPTAVFPVGAKGLSQFMPATWAEYSTGDPFNPELAIEAQSKYMDRLIAMFGGDVELALASYNWGEGRVKARLLKHNATKWADIERYAPQETKDYVKRILQYYAEYQRDQETAS
jgi:soluble lytic murein transglycosylase